MKQSLIEALKAIPDPRKGNAIKHKLNEIIFIALLCVICNGDTFKDMEVFGKLQIDVLSKFLELPYGIPSHDTFSDVFAALNPKKVFDCFNGWVNELRDEITKCNVSIDGKTVRRSKCREKNAVHVVTAFAGELQMTLGQLATDEKSNEITAIPKLLEMFTVKDNIITIDAMGTQTDIAKTIIDKKGDYVLALKNNHPSLFEDVSLYLEQEVLPHPKADLAASGLYHKTLEKDHGRIETRECYLCHDISWLEARSNWAALAGVGVIISKREELGKEPITSKHFFLYSMKDANAEQLLKIKRGHWSIENQLHWMLDVVFHEDDNRARTKNAAENLNILRKQALQLMKRDTSNKDSMRIKRWHCSMDIFYAFKLMGVNQIS